jgi:hypothetical protein
MQMAVYVQPPSPHDEKLLGLGEQYEMDMCCSVAWEKRNSRTLFKCCYCDSQTTRFLAPLLQLCSMKLSAPLLRQIRVLLTVSRSFASNC